MQAVILSGGQGTRLRPLTSTTPKPAVPLANRPMISYMVDWLHGHGVDDVVMSVGFLAEGLRAALDEAGHDGVEIRYVEEPEPLGTAGAVKYAERFLDERFLVLNGDVLTAFDISSEIAQHERTGARATLALVPVEDPTAFGLVLTDEQSRITAFLEKPDAADVPPNPRINAGAYVLQRDVLDMLEPGVNASFEHDVFPHLPSEQIYAFEAGGYWLDLGTPERYMVATRDLLDGEFESWLSARLSASGGVVVGDGVDVSACELSGPLLIGERCELGAGTRLSDHTTLGDGCRTGRDCVLARAVLQRGCELGDGVTVEAAIIGPEVRIGDGATIAAGSVIGEGAVIEPGAIVAAESRVEAGATTAA